MPTTPRYDILVPDETAASAAAYLQALRDGTVRPGGRLNGRLSGTDLAALTAHDLLGALFDTKEPQIFAESAVAGDGSDWTLLELGLLGDISVAVPVTVYDDGRHADPTPHAPPFAGTLVFTPGALLRNGTGHPPADWADAVHPDGTLSADGYEALCRRRLLPVFRWINARAGRPRSAFVTVPGLGCGQFAGPFRGRLGAHLEAAIDRLLTDHGDELPNVAAVYYDPYNECANARRDRHGIAFLTRPLAAPGNVGKPQLCRPSVYAEPGDDFAACVLFSIVAWDHVSWPGNDFYGGSRATDDGVKAAATDAMAALTGVAGAYDTAAAQYRPPPPFETWGDVVRERQPRLWNVTPGA